MTFSPSLLHADLTGDGIDEIILVLPNATSNFAATNVHVLSAANGGLAEVLTVLCTSNQEGIDTYRQTLVEMSDTLCTGASVIDFNGRSALRIEQLSRRSIAYTDVLWDGGKWIAEPQEVKRYFLYGNSRTTDIPPQPLPVLDESQVIRTLITEKTEGFTQTVYRSDRDEEPNWNFYSYFETGGVKYDLGQIGYGNDDYFKDGLKYNAFGKFMDIDGVTLYTQRKWYGSNYDAMAYYEILDGVPCFRYEVANAAEYYQDGNLLTVLSSSRSQPLNITLFCFDISNGMVFSEDMRELLDCWAVGYDFEQKLVYAYDESNKNDPFAVYKLEGMELAAVFILGCLLFIIDTFVPFPARYPAGRPVTAGYTIPARDAPHIYNTLLSYRPAVNPRQPG